MQTILQLVSVVWGHRGVYVGLGGIGFMQTVLQLVSGSRMLTFVTKDLLGLVGNKGKYIFLHIHTYMYIFINIYIYIHTFHIYIYIYIGIVCPYPLQISQ